MPRQSDRAQIEELLAKYEPMVRKTFMDAIAEIRDSVVLKIIVERLEKGDINGALDALNLDTAAFARLELAIAEAYNAGGAALVENLPRLTDPQGNRVVFRFGVRNTPGEAELRAHSAGLVTRTTEDMKDAIRAALTDGLAQGQNPTRTASQVIGKTSRVTGRREGGIIGLTAPQERYVASARAELSSGDPAALRNYLTRVRRDKRFDRTIAKAIKDEKPIPAAMVDKIAGRYSDSLLKLRGDLLARTETMWSLSKSRDDAMRQQITAGKIDAQDVTKEWVATHDGRTRFTHRELDGQKTEFEGRFQSVSGAMLAYPHDPAAPTSEVVGCRCAVTYRVDRIGALARTLGR